MTNLPTTPEACRALRGCVLAFLEGVTPTQWSAEAGSVFAPQEDGSQNRFFANFQAEGPTATRAAPLEMLRNAYLAAQAPALALAYADLLEAHAQALEAAQWVSVEDALPEEGEWVMIAVCGKIEAQRAYHNGENWQGGFFAQWEEEQVKYWQPLPTPPVAGATAGQSKE